MHSLIMILYQNWYIIVSSSVRGYFAEYWEFDPVLLPGVEPYRGTTGYYSRISTAREKAKADIRTLSKGKRLLGVSPCAQHKPEITIEKAEFLPQENLFA